MKTILFITTVIVSHVAGGQATGDMRTFAMPTQVVLQRNPFNPKANTVGTQYLFPDWVHGTLITNDGQKFSEYLYDLDKISQGLYRIQADSTVFLIDKMQIKWLSLNDGQTTYEFEKVPSLKDDQLYRILAKGSKYSLYSLISTKFIPSNYTSNGIVTKGNLYDEFKDEVSYYLVTADGTAKQVSLKKKAFVSALEAEKPAIEKFFKDNSDATQNEAFYKQLVISLNQ